MAFTKTQVDEQIGGVYGEIYVHDGATPETIATGAGYTKCTAFASNGLSQDTTPDQTNDKITITKAGVYSVECSLSFTGATNSINWFGAVFVDGTEQNQIHFERKLGIGGDYGSAQIGGFVNVTSVPVDIDLRFRHDRGSDDDITVRYANLNVNRVGI